MAVGSRRRDLRLQATPRQKYNNHISSLFVAVTNLCEQIQRNEWVNTESVVELLSDRVNEWATEIVAE